MTARIAGFVSRADAGLTPPRSVSRRITPEQGGVALHYGGPAQRITDHGRCLAVWRAWQRYHVEVKGWADLAYTGGACDHGYAFAGRGAGVRTAANGTNAGNDDYYAVVWLGGAGETPTVAALDAFDWWLAELRRAGGAGRRVRPHRVFTATACPGPELVDHAAARDNRDVPLDNAPPPPPPPKPPAPKPAPKPAPEEDPMPPTIREGARGDVVRRLQALLVAARHDLSQEGGIDGIFGPGVKRELVAFQRARGLSADGIVGPATWRRLILG